MLRDADKEHCKHTMIRMRKVSDMVEEAYCLNCDDVIGFRIETRIFGELDKQWERKLEGKVRQLDDYEKEELK